MKQKIQLFFHVFSRKSVCFLSAQMADGDEAASPDGESVMTKSVLGNTLNTTLAWPARASHALI